MKPGLRLQILVLLGALLAVGFVPLYFAVETYAEVALSRAEAEHARHLGQIVASSAVETYRSRPGALRDVLQATTSRRGVEAVGVFAADGKRVEGAGAPALLEHLPGNGGGAEDASREVVVAGRRLTLVSVASPGISASVLVSHAPPSATLLTELLALYMALVAVLLLAAAYLTLTRWIVRPIAELSRAAQRVAETTQHFEPPPTRSRELGELSESLRLMTEKLLDEERAMRAKVEEVERATGQLKRAQAQLVRSERLASVGQLAAGLAHEVGNPIAAMRGMQDLILTGDLPPETQKDFIQRMRKETERINRILRDLLDFARPSSEGPSAAEPGSVETAVHETTTLLMPQPLLRNVELELDIYPDLPPVRLHQSQLTQVLLNLLLNAAQSCENGGTVRVSATRDGNDVRVVVSDDGPGVPEPLRERIFEPFVSSKDVGEGSGLGLAVCRGLVESVEGSIALSTTHAPGAAFVLTLPVASPTGNGGNVAAVHR